VAISIDRGSYFLGVVCPSASQCTAVGGGAHEVTFDPASPASSAPVRIPRANQLDAVSCPSATECIAVDLAGYGFAGFAPGVHSSPPPVSATPPAIAAISRAATGRKTTSVVLHGLVDTGGAAVTWQFKFGKSRTYGNGTLLQTIPAGAGQVAVSRKLTGLRPNTVYHFRLVATATSGGNVITASGTDLVFKTNPTGKLVLSSGKLTVMHGLVSVSLRCSSKLPCQGRFSITTKAKVRKRHKLATVVCASTSFKLRAHQQKQLSTRISGACAALLRDAQRHRISGQFSSTLRTGQLGPNRRVSLSL
jgi:hypothetical protein